MDKKTVFRLGLLLYWLMFLIPTDSYYSVYLLAGGAALVYLSCNHFDYAQAVTGSVVTRVFAYLFSFMVILANYKIVLETYSATGKVFWIIYTVLSAVALILGGAVVYKAVLSAAFTVIEQVRSKVLFSKKGTAEGISETKWFLQVFGVGTIFYLIIFFLFNYPGIVSVDTIHQLRMIQDSAYSTHHPLLHTLMIKVFYQVGYGLFHSVNAAIAAVSLFQILCVAAIFSYGAVTVYRFYGRKASVVFALIYFLLPYNIEFSATHRKDTLFSCFIFLMIVAYYRLSRLPIRKKADYFLLLLGAFGTGAFRKNGLYVLAACFVLYILIFVKDKISNEVFMPVLLIMIIATVTSFALTPILKSALKAEDPDILETVGVPLQQVARVIADGCEIDEGQMQLLSQVIDIEGLKNAYVPYTVDPAKEYVRSGENVDYIEKHKAEFVSLYFELGLKYPGEYVKAWIDQTRGYWNGGYKYWRWEQGVTENKLGISRSYPFELFFRVMCEYLWLWQNVPLIIPFLCIGLFTWGIMMMLNLSILGRNRTVSFMTLPVLLNIGTLIIATPVFAEFRYAYSSFLCLPFIVLAYYYDYETLKDGNRK